MYYTMPDWFCLLTACLQTRIGRTTNDEGRTEASSVVLALQAGIDKLRSRRYSNEQVWIAKVMRLYAIATPLRRTCHSRLHAAFRHQRRNYNPRHFAHCAALMQLQIATNACKRKYDPPF
jgi:hypothetical protein